MIIDGRVIADSDFDHLRAYTESRDSLLEDVLGLPGRMGPARFLELSISRQEESC